jgi:glucosamine--fructose-6-phosphate aminotransferase (isomerizing)
MTHFLRDILRQTGELQRALGYLRGEGQAKLDAATNAIRNAHHVYLTGIGSSWHAALCAASLFHRSGHPVYLLDASELASFGKLAEDSVVIAISRSGRSAEIVNLLPQARQSGATVIGVTSSADGTLARDTEIPIVVPVPLDHAISVNTYSSLALATGAIAASVVGSFDGALAAHLSRALNETARVLPEWQEQLANTSWLAPGATHYFLARGSSVGNCHEARLMWEEGVKSPATAMGTGSFRHGPQEIVAKDMRFAIWIDGRQMREQDLAVARDLRQLGASVMLLGQDLPNDAANLVFQLPSVLSEWQFLIDIIPAQLAAERLAGLSGVDCDSFRLCSFIVEDEYGLLHEEVGAPKQKK